MNLRSLLQDILSEVSSKIISFQMELHLLITLVRSSDYFRLIESLRTCIIASHYTVLQKKGNLSPSFYRAQMQLTKFSKLKIVHAPGKNLTVADMLSRTLTKEQLQIHQLRHKQLPPQIDFSIMKDDQLKPVHYLVKHEEK